MLLIIFIAIAEANIIMASPEALLEKKWKKEIGKIKISYLCFDEAHVIESWLVIVLVVSNSKQAHTN